MQIISFKDMYIAELQELASMEKQLGEALLLMSRIAAHPTLKDALRYHRDQSRAQMERLESMLQAAGVAAGGLRSLKPAASGSSDSGNRNGSRRP